MNPEGANVTGEDKSIHRIGVASLVAFLAAFFILFHWNYPDAGHDFGGILVKMMEGSWHFHHLGLAIPRYAVHVCGGSVLYGNPEDMFYSPAQMLCLVLDPWITIQLTICGALIVGYIGWYRVGCGILGLSKAWSHLLALVLEANGFYFLQMLSGHFMFHSLALLGWFILLLFEGQDVSAWAAAKRAIAFALLCAYALYSGGWFVLYFLAIGFVLVLPLDLYLSDSPKTHLLQMARRVGLFAVVTLAITASKLVAIYSFMRFFSRRTPLEVLDPSLSTINYVLKALWAIPQNSALFEGMPSFVHERSMLTAPITLVGLAVGIVLLGRRLYLNSGRSQDHWFVAIYGSVTFTAMVQLVRGRGWIAEVLHRLPVGASQRLSSRYLYLFALLLSVASVWSLAKLLKRAGRGWNTVVISFAAATTVAAFAFAHVKMLREVGLASNMGDHRAHWREVDRGRPVNIVTGFTNFNGATGRTCYEPILNAAGNPSLVLHEGSIFDQQDGYFNLMKPACYQYPDENQCQPGSRIPIADSDNLQRFTQGEPVTWSVSWLQTLADILSGLSLVLCLIALRYARAAARRQDLSGKVVGPID